MAVILVAALGIVCVLLTTAGVTLHSQTHFVGETAHIQCGETSESPVLWFYQLKFIVDEHNRHNISGDHLTSGDRRGRVKLSGRKLIIENVTEGDRGIYACVETAAAGHEVKYQLRLDIEAQKNFSRKSLTAVVGESVTLPCITALPTPVDWRHDGKFVCSVGTLLNSYKERFKLDRSAFGDFSITIPNVTKADEGVYICIEDAGLGMEHIVTLNVTEEAKFWRRKDPSNEYLERAILVSYGLIILLFIITTSLVCYILCRRKCCRQPNRIPEETRQTALTDFCENNYQRHHTESEMYDEGYGAEFPEERSIDSFL